MIKTSVRGRLRNTSLPKSRPLLPLFEAVVNSIQSIDDRFERADAGEISIHILRSDEPDLFDGAPDAGPSQKAIIGFRVEDNGEGFTPRNMESFLTLDSEQKTERGGRGVGRLLWLKAFKRVEVRSRLVQSEDGHDSVSFSFTANEEVVPNAVEGSRAGVGASVTLLGFDQRLQAVAPKQAQPIARAIMEHCLWYFLREGGAPHLQIVDENETVSLDAVFEEYTAASSYSETLTVSGKEFALVHLRLKPTMKSVPYLHWCAASRDVIKENLIGRIPGLYGRLEGEGLEFMYACYLTSPYLDENVRAERTAFDIPENADGALHGDPSISEIRAVVHDAVEAHLRPSLEKTRKAGRDLVEDYVQRKSPRYRPILPHIDDDKLSVNPNLSDRELEVTLHGYLADIDRDLIIEGHRVLNPTPEQDVEEYQAQLQGYLERLKDVNMSDLAAYVARRRVVLDLLQKAIEVDEGGRYQKEEVVHSLIMPRGRSSNESDSASSNLWLIDEGLAFHDYLGSDKTISSAPITTNPSLKRPDLLCFTAVDNPVLVSEAATTPLATITIVEIKRPMRDDAKEGEANDPIEQAKGYLRRVRKGQVTTARGRPIPESQTIPGFIYIIADLTTTMVERCQLADLTRTQDGEAWFGYHSNLQTYIEVMSFDRLHRNATRRNRAFFDRLGLPSA